MTRFLQDVATGLSCAGALYRLTRWKRRFGLSSRLAILLLVMAIGAFYWVNHTIRPAGAERVLTSPRDHWVAALDFSPDGRWLAGSGIGVTIWGTETWRQVAVLDAKAHILAFSSDGQRLAAVNAAQRFAVDSILLWKLEGGKFHQGGSLHSPCHELTGLAWTTDGTNLASSQISEMIFSDGPTPGFVRIWYFAREPARESAHFDVL